MHKLILPIALVLSLTACGYDGNFRYPCQDPANWEAVECVPPVCHAYDYCTKDLIPDDALAS
jgi:hypothetical protein